MYEKVIRKIKSILDEELTRMILNNLVKGSYFANYCEQCNNIKGDNYILNEQDSPISSCIADEIE